MKCRSLFSVTVLILCCSLSDFIRGQDAVPDPIPGNPPVNGGCNNPIITGDIVNFGVTFQNHQPGPPPTAEIKITSKADIENWKFGETEFTHFVRVHPYVQFPVNLQLGAPIELPPLTSIDVFTLAKCGRKNTSDCAPTIEIKPWTGYKIEAVVAIVTRHKISRIDEHGNLIEEEHVGLTILDAETTDYQWIPGHLT